MIHAWRKRRLSEYLDGALEGRARARIERHLERCGECRNEEYEQAPARELFVCVDQENEDGRVQRNRAEDSCDERELLPHGQIDEPEPPDRQR
jgi:anti-sigma factor RsiW